MIIGVGLQGRARSLARLQDLNPSGILIMQEGIQDARDLRTTGCSCGVWIRFYHPDIMSLPPKAYAKYLWEWAVSTLPSYITHLIPFNELNLKVEHKDKLCDSQQWDSLHGYAEQLKWQMEFIAEFKRLDTDHIFTVHYGALSPGHNPLGSEPETEYDILAPVLKLFDIVDIHVYGPLDDLWDGVKRAERIIPKLNSLGIPTDKIAITETNQVNYVELVEYLAEKFPKLAGVFWFLWDADDPSHKGYDLVDVDYLSQLKITIEEVRNMAIEWYGRFAAMAWKMGEEAGTPVSKPSFPVIGIEQQLSTTGLFVYLKGADVGYFVPWKYSMGVNGELVELLPKV